MPITVSIVEDNDQLRATLARVINRAEGFECLSHYQNAEAALEALANLGYPSHDCLEGIHPAAH